MDRDDIIVAAILAWIFWPRAASANVAVRVTSDGIPVRDESAGYGGGDSRGRRWQERHDGYDPPWEE